MRLLLGPKLALTERLCTTQFRTKIQNGFSPCRDFAAAPRATRPLQRTMALPGAVTTVMPDRPMLLSVPSMSAVKACCEERN